MYFTYITACFVSTGIYHQVYLPSELSTHQLSFKATDGGLIYSLAFNGGKIMFAKETPNENLWGEAVIATSSSECNSYLFLSDGWKSEYGRPGMSGLTYGASE